MLYARSAKCAINNTLIVSEVVEVAFLLFKHRSKQLKQIRYSIIAKTTTQIRFIGSMLQPTFLSVLLRPIPKNNNIFCRSYLVFF